MDEMYQDDEWSEDEAQENPRQNPAEILMSFIGQDNIAPLLDEETLTKIGQEVLRGYDLDKSSREEWEKQNKIAMDLAMQVAEEKSWPWPKAANVKFPLITTAAIQFSARAYPAIVQGEQVVKGMVIGPDQDGSKKDRARRIGEHMSFQLLEEMEGWDEDTDKLLLRMAIVGCEFRKTYFDSAMGRNASELVPAKHLVFDHATPYHKLRRKTQELFLFKNEVLERVRSGLFREIELGLPQNATGDEDDSHEFLECHCWYDLDGDDYKEPYVCTVLKKTGEVARIVARFDEEAVLLNAKSEIARIEQIEHFTKFSFLPNPDGGSYDIGLGILLNPINATVNTVINQLLDAGTLANVGGGFIGSGLRMKGGPVRLAPGEFKPVDNNGGAIRDNIYHMQFPGPSPVLFQLLGLLIDAGKDISSTKDILTGDQDIKQTATTTLALIEQGQKVFSAIYKRVHRALKQEFAKLYRLNSLYLEPEAYYRFNDKQDAVFLEDYKGDGTDVAPVSDPTLISDAQILAKAEALMKFVGDPFVNQKELRRRYLEAIKEEAPESLIQDPPQPPQDPKAVEMMAKVEILEKEAIARIEKLEAETTETKASAILKLAQAEAAELGNQMQAYVQQMQMLGEMMSNQFRKHLEEMQNGSGGIRGMEASPDNTGGASLPGGLPAVDSQEMVGGGVQPADFGSLGNEELRGDEQGAVLPGPGGA